MIIKEWILTQLWDDVFFRPERLGPVEMLHAVEFRRPLVSLLIDGFLASAPWGAKGTNSLTECLFAALRPIIARFGASQFTINNPDDAMSEFMGESVIDLNRFGDQALWIFERSPVQEAGACYVGIGLHTKNWMLVFERAGGLRIVCYGDPFITAELKANLGLASEAHPMITKVMGPEP